MPSQKHRFHAVEHPDAQSIGCRSKRRLESVLGHLRQALDRIEATATDDTNPC